MEDKDPQRIVLLDVLRGYAILGIFLVNMLSFHSPVLYLNPFTWWESELDQNTYMLIDIIAQGSFYPLFALLFGYSFIKLRESAMKRGERFVPIALRRLLLLLIIGILHASLVWHGDILITYAIFGFLYLLFLRMSAKGLFITGTLFYLIPNLLIILLFFVSLQMLPLQDAIMYDQQAAEQSVAVYQQGSFSEITVQRLTDWYAVNQPSNMIFMIFWIFPFFLIGGAAAKYRLLERINEHKRPLFIFTIIFFSTGLFLKLTPYIFTRNIATEYLQDIFGGPILTAAYISGIAIALETRIGSQLLTRLAPVGKMSMSNYLFQSVLATSIFYSYGFGLYDRISVFVATAIAILIYIFQLSFSAYWLKKHPYGMIEWIWRSFSYMRFAPWERKDIT